MVLPVLASKHHRLPAQSGTYSRPPTTTGVADTSEPVVKAHLGWMLAMLEGLRAVSA